MVVRYKHTYGNGTVDLVDVEIPDEAEIDDEELSDTEALGIILGGAE